MKRLLFLGAVVGILCGLVMSLFPGYWGLGIYATAVAISIVFRKRVTEPGNQVLLDAFGKRATNMYATVTSLTFLIVLLVLGGSLLWIPAVALCDTYERVQRSKMVKST